MYRYYRQKRREWSVCDGCFVYKANQPTADAFHSCSLLCIQIVINLLYASLSLCVINLGLKKFMWPIFIGMQVVKTVLLAMFLPSIIGSLGKIVGKGKLIVVNRC